MMEKLKFGDFVKDVFDVEFNVFKSGTELLFTYECRKYLALEGIDLTAEGLDILDALLTGSYFAFVRNEGLVFDEPYMQAESGGFDRRDYFLDTLDDINLGFNEDSINFTTRGDLKNKKYMTNFAYSPKCYLSLMAYVSVYNFINKTSLCLIIDNSTETAGAFEYSELCILQEYGNKLVSGDFLQMYVNDGYAQIPWEGFWMYNQQIGLMLKDYTTVEKFDELSANYIVGDVVLLYTKEKQVKSHKVTKLLSCVPCVIKSITESHIELNKYTDITTTTTMAEKIRELDSDLYSAVDVNEFYVARVKFDYSSIGVRGCTSLEEFFITDVVEGDYTIQYIEDVENGGITSVQLDTIDTVYCVFKNRGVKFNEERFIAKYYTQKGKSIPGGQYYQK